MDVKYKISCGILTIYFSGELDEHTSSNARIILDRLFLDNSNVKRVIYDLSGITFMDSTGIGLLIGRYKKLKQFNIPSYISGASVNTEKIIEIAGLYDIMPKY